MPSHQKQFRAMKSAEYESMRQRFRSLGWIAPHGESGFLRSSDGLLADVRYDAKTEDLSVSIRDLPKGETHASILRKIEQVFQNIDR